MTDVEELWLSPYQAVMWSNAYAPAGGCLFVCLKQTLGALVTQYLTHCNGMNRPCWGQCKLELVKVRILVFFHLNKPGSIGVPEDCEPVIRPHLSRIKSPLPPFPKFVLSVFTLNNFFEQLYLNNWFTELSLSTQAQLNRNRTCALPLLNFKFFPETTT